LQQAMNDRQSEMNDLQAEMNDKPHQMRELQRQQRLDSAIDIDSEMERLNDEIGALGEEIGELGESIGESQETWQTELRTQLASVHQAYAAQVFSTLCNYGNTLRSLSNGQHVSIVLRNHEENPSRVYVLDYSALSSCSSGESLQQATVTYVQ
jgi:chromosome segregation ATPase